MTLRQRLSGLSLLACLACLVALTARVEPAASEPVDGYCSPSGDYCHSVSKTDRGVFLSIATFSFTGRYLLCVRHLSSGYRDCKEFPLRRRDSIYSSRISFNRQFSQPHRGRWCATWHKFGSRLGPRDCFRYRGAVDRPAAR